MLTKKLACFPSDRSFRATIHHQTYFDGRRHLLTVDTEFVTLGEVMVHTGMAVGCRRRSHRNQLCGSGIHNYTST
jgi:hypothetical protein